MGTIVASSPSEFPRAIAIFPKKRTKGKSWKYTQKDAYLNFIAVNFLLPFGSSNNKRVLQKLHGLPLTMHSLSLLVLNFLIKWFFLTHFASNFSSRFYIYTWNDCFEYFSFDLVRHQQLAYLYVLKFFDLVPYITLVLKFNFLKEKKSKKSAFCSQKILLFLFISFFKKLLIIS